MRIMERALTLTGLKSIPLTSQLKINLKPNNQQNKIGMSCKISLKHIKWLNQKSLIQIYTIKKKPFFIRQKLDRD